MNWRISYDSKIGRGIPGRNMVNKIFIADSFLKITKKEKYENRKSKYRRKLNQIHDLWNPRVVGELNGQHLKLTKANGEFVWHKHDNEDEMFLVIKGSFKIELDREAHILLFEPAGTLNTGNVKNEFTKEALQKI